MTSDPDNPLVTLSITCFNHEDYIEEAVQSALNQTYSSLQIIISDDCSTDQSWDIIQKTVANYTGPHKLTIRQNEVNLGLVKHINLIMELAQGKMLIGCSGDDIQMPHRVQSMVDIWQENGAGDILIHGPVTPIDLKGQIASQDMFPPICISNPSIEDIALKFETYIGASSAFSMSLIKKFPPMAYDNVYEDLIWSFRATLQKCFIYNPKITIYYRIGAGITTKAVPQNKGLEKMISLYQRLYDILRQRRDDLLFFDDIQKTQHAKKKIEKELVFYETFLSLALKEKTIFGLLSGDNILYRLKAVRKYYMTYLRNL